MLSIVNKLNLYLYPFSCKINILNKTILFYNTLVMYKTIITIN